MGSTTIPHINPHRTAPSPAQVEYATGLCYAVLPNPTATLHRFDEMSRAEMTRLILSLKHELATRGARRLW